MARPGTVDPYRVHADPFRRLVVIRGYATASADGKRVKSYDVEAVIRIWEEWPTTSLIEFGRYWGIPYQTLISKKYPFSVARKKQAMVERQRGWRASVMSRAMLPECIDETSEIAALRVVLRQIKELGQAGVTYAHERMVKHGEFGKRVNVALPLNEARRVLTIGHKAAQILGVYAGVREITRGELATDEPTARTEPRAIVATALARQLPPRISP